MNWEDDCYLLSKRKFRENGSIINIFTQKKGKIKLDHPSPPRPVYNKVVKVFSVPESNLVKI